MVNKVKMGDIKPVKKTVVQTSSGNLAIKQNQNRPAVSEIKKEINKDYVSYESIPKELRATNKLKKFTIIFLVILIVSWVVLYFFSVIDITIIPKKDVQKLNKEVTMFSWTKPLKLTVMSIDEKVPVANKDNLAGSKIKLDEKVRNRLIYDMPTGYKMVGNCKSGIIYTEPVFDTNQKDPQYLQASTSVLIFESSSLEKFVLNNLYTENKHLKNMDSLSCELLSDIKIKDIKSNQVSFVLKGDMVLMPDINTDDLKTKISFKTQKQTRNILKSNEDIFDVILNTKPFAVFPVLPKNIKNINITVNEDIN